MADQRQYTELARHLSAVTVVKRDLARMLPHQCPAGSAAVLSLLHHHGEMRMSRLAELLGIDMSVTSRHVAHVAEQGWVDRQPDPLDKRSRLLRLNASGERLLREISDRYVEALADVLHEWSEEEVGQLNRLLARLRDSFGDCRPRGHLGVDCPTRTAPGGTSAATEVPPATAGAATPPGPEGLPLCPQPET